MYCSSGVHFSQCDISVSALIVLNILGTGFAVLTVVRIHNVVWVMTLYSLVHGYECFGGAFWAYLHRPLEDGDSTS
jgi:hypothetical protein